MIWLVFAELRHSPRAWTGVFALAIVTGLVAFVAGALLVSSGHYAGSTRQLVANSGQMLAVFTSISALVGVTGASNLTVALQRRTLALWRLAGVRSGAVGLMTLVQLAMVGSLGAGVGCLAAGPMLGPFFDWVQGIWIGTERIEPHVGASTIFGTIVAVAGLVVLGGLRGAMSASRTEPIEALREPEPPTRTMGRIRWGVAAGVLAVTLALVWRLEDAPFGEQVNRGMFLIPALAGLVASLGPLVFPTFLRVWTSILPPRLAPSWFLARHDARYRLSQSTAVIGPLMVGIALAAAVPTGAATFGATADGGDWTIDPEPLVLMLGGPLLVAAATAAVTVFMVSGGRERGAALVQVAGGGRRTVILAAAWEALIHAATATMLGVAVTAAGAFALADAVGIAEPQIAWLPVVLVAIGGAALILLATVIPALTALRVPLSRMLAAV